MPEDINESGLILGQSVQAAKAMQRTSSTRVTGEAVGRALTAGRQGVIPTDKVEANRMRKQRMASMNRNGSMLGGAGGSGSVNFATQRPHDPFFYWQQNNLPYDFNNPEHLMLLRALCRHVYKAHSVMASAIDIYSYWPLLGMEFTCKDKSLVEFHTDLFFDQLDYEEYLPSILHEYWTVGEAFPLGSFNETLGVWDGDELLNPDDVFVEKSPFIKDPNLYIRLPETLRRVLQTGQPPEQYHALMRSYPELKAYAHENTKMPVSNILLKHLKFKGDNYAARGLPIMYRALRPLMQEEMLNAAQDAIADRLYTPLILAKIGASATDLGTDEPWIPTPGQIGDFETNLDAALAADFRVLTTHFAVDMESVFGRETMPNLDADFDRVTEKQLQAFGMSKTMLSGAETGETYAADAMNRDLISQLLNRAQRYIRRFVKDRMLVVAEAQGHYDYEVRGGRRYPVMEEVLEVDEETGEQRIVEQPKLLIPDLKLQNMNLKDEEKEREFLEALRAEGVPISQERRLVNIDLDLKEETEKVSDEQVEQAVEAQRVRKRTYQKLHAEGLPIPEDLLADFQAKPVQVKQQEEAAAAGPVRVPTLGLDPQDTSALAPTPDVQMMPPGQPLGIPAGPGGTITAPTPAGGPENPSRPPESDEMRAGMPTAASKVPDHLLPMEPVEAAKVVELLPRNKMKEALAEHMPGTPVATTPEGQVIYMPGTDQPIVGKEGGLLQGPRHIGLRRYAAVDPTKPMDPEPEAEEA